MLWKSLKMHVLDWARGSSCEWPPDCSRQMCDHYPKGTARFLGSRPNQIFWLWIFPNSSLISATPVLATSIASESSCFSNSRMTCERWCNSSRRQVSMTSMSLGFNLNLRLYFMQYPVKAPVVRATKVSNRKLSGLGVRLPWTVPDNLATHHKYRRHWPLCQLTCSRMLDQECNIPQELLSVFDNSHKSALL